MKASLERRSGIEPEIVHMKQDGKLGRCCLKGILGDAMNNVLSAAGHNIRRLLNGLKLFWLLLLSRVRARLFDDYGIQADYVA